MKKNELKEKIAEVIDKGGLGSLATVKDGKPWVRYMAMARLDSSLDVYSSSFAASRKIEQIKKDKNVHVAIGGDPNDWARSFVNMQGTAEVITDPAVKKKCWRDMLSNFFSGPEDPNYVVVKVSPEIIEYTAAGTHKPEIYKA